VGDGGAREPDALGVYEHVGMVVVETYQHFALDLR
jgi:hypothetical protein